MSVEFLTLGCRLNAAESEAMRALAPAGAAMIVVNSCAVTNEAVRQTRQAIRKAKRRRPDARILVTGCAAQIDPQGFTDMAEVDRVISNHQKLDPGAWATEPGFEAPLDVPAFSERARAFVAVQNGCDHRCTFCIIPFGRGDSRSVPAGAVIERIDALVAAGRQEIVLTGVDLTSYGPDLPGAPSLGLLVERILTRVPKLKRLRLSSLDCIEIDERLFEIATGEPRFMPHLHLSFQSGDDMILKRMKRRHDRAQAIRIVERLKARRSDIAIGADMIAGFPTESDAMHENSLRLLDECDVVHGHIFPFSPRAGTPAARMPQLPGPLIRERARQLRETCAGRRTRWLASQVGSLQQVLIEGGNSGHAGNFANVTFAGEAAPGAIVAAQITGSDAERLTGVSV